METQGIRLQVTTKEVFNKRDILIDAAYEALDQFVTELLQYTEGDTDIGIEAVPNLPIVVRCFKELAEFCESVVDKQTLEAVEAMQEFGEDGQIVERVKLWQAKLRTTLEGLSSAISTAWGHFETHHQHHMDAQEALRKAKERRSVGAAFSLHLN